MINIKKIGDLLAKQIIEDVNKAYEFDDGIIEQQVDVDGGFNSCEITFSGKSSADIQKYQADDLSNNGDVQVAVVARKPRTIKKVFSIKGQAYVRTGSKDIKKIAYSTSIPDAVYDTYQDNLPKYKKQLHKLIMKNFS